MLTSHVYWFVRSASGSVLEIDSGSCRNLDGFHGSDDVLAHEVKVASSRFLEVDDNQLPTGGFVDVTDTPYDFNKLTPIGDRIHEVKRPGFTGYDIGTCAVQV